MIIEKRIKQLRSNQKISQQELGNILGVTKVSVSCYENGKRVPSLDTLIKIAKYFNTSLDYLVGREKKIYNEESNKYVGAISEQDIELIYELKHYPNLYNKITKDIKKSINQINKKIK